MNDRIKSMVEGRRSDAGFSTLEIVIFIVVSVILAGAIAGLFFILTGNANQNNGINSGEAAYNAIKSYYGDYGSLPANSGAIDTYATTAGDDSPKAGLQAGTTMKAFPVSGSSSKFTIEVTNPDWNNAIVIDITGKATKVAKADFTANTGTAFATWTS